VWLLRVDVPAGCGKYFVCACVRSYMACLDHRFQFVGFGGNNNSLYFVCYFVCQRVVDFLFIKKDQKYLQCLVFDSIFLFSFIVCMVVVMVVVVVVGVL
jgi:hypothetical protein